MGWLVSPIILLASIPILHNVSAGFFAPLFDEEIDENAFIYVLNNVVGFDSNALPAPSTRKNYPLTVTDPKG